MSHDTLKSVQLTAIFITGVIKLLHIMVEDNQKIRGEIAQTLLWILIAGIWTVNA